MNKKLSVLLSASASIAACASLIAGSTFALFTSEAKTNIAVTAGKVNVTASVKEDSVKLYSLDNGELDPNPMEGTEFRTGGTATVEADGSLTLSNMVPGDRVEFTIDITNNSNVAIKYKPSITCDDGLALFGLLEKKFNGETYVNWGEWTSVSAGKDIEDVTVSIGLPATVGNAGQGLSATMAFTVNAIQGNAKIAEPTGTEEVAEAGTSEALAEALTPEKLEEKSEVGLMGSLDVTEAQEDYPGAGVLFGQGQSADDAKIDATVDGNGNTVTLDHTAFNYYTPNVGESGQNQEGVLQGTLVFKNIHFKAATPGKGYALVLGIDSDANVTFDHCVFEDMYTAVLCNPSTKDPTITIENCEYINTLWGYSVDTTTGSEFNNINFNNNKKIGVYHGDSEIFGSKVVEGNSVGDIQETLDELLDTEGEKDVFVDLGGDLDVSKQDTPAGRHDGIQVAPGTDLTVNGDGKVVTLDHSAFNYFNSTEGLMSGTIVFRNVHFKAATPGQGFAVVLGFNSTAHVIFENCTFENLYSAVYCNENREGGAEVEIIGCTFINTTETKTYGYSVYDSEDVTKSSVNVTFENNVCPTDGSKFAVKEF